MPEKFVTIEKDGRTSKVAKSAFEKVWKQRGWNLSGEVAEPQPQSEAESPPESASDDEESEEGELPRRTLHQRLFGVSDTKEDAS